MKPAPPIEVTPLFPRLHQALVELLDSLSPAEWGRSSPCPGWTVQDLAAHLLADDLGLLSRKRDGHSYLPPEFAALDFEDWQQFVAFINFNNDIWLQATRRLSPTVLLDMLQHSGPQVSAYFASLDPLAIDEPVHWAGSQPAPVWLDLAREYTERWMHQQHIRMAVDRPGLMGTEFFLPLLDAFARALPHSCRHTAATEGAALTWRMERPFAHSWTLQLEDGSWQLYHGEPSQPTARITLDGESAWLLFTKGLAPQEAQKRAVIEGDAMLAQPFFETVSILA